MQPYVRKFRLMSAARLSISFVAFIVALFTTGKSQVRFEYVIASLIFWVFVALFYAAFIRFSHQMKNNNPLRGRFVVGRFIAALAFLGVSSLALFGYTHIAYRLDINTSLMVIVACLTHGSYAFMMLVITVALKRERI